MHTGPIVRNKQAALAHPPHSNHSTNSWPTVVMTAKGWTEWLWTPSTLRFAPKVRAPCGQWPTCTCPSHMPITCQPFNPKMVDEVVVDSLLGLWGSSLGGKNEECHHGSLFSNRKERQSLYQISQPFFPEVPFQTEYGYRCTPSSNNQTLHTQLKHKEPQSVTTRAPSKK